MTDILLYKLAWWASGRRIDWLCAIIYRYRCPHPIIDDHSVRACINGGHCGCDNADRSRHPTERKFMSEMVERVAKAIARVRDDDYHPWEEFKELYREEARAAIDAMREPTHKMICAALDANDKGGRAFSDWYRAMIDEALDIPDPEKSEV